MFGKNFKNSLKCVSNKFQSQKDIMGVNLVDLKLNLKPKNDQQ